MSPSERAAIAAARDAASKAYAPYSQFQVGAALVTEQDEIITGCNVENASFGLTLCAERGAAMRAVVQGSRFFFLLAIYTATESPTPPCGACRQFLREFAPNLRILMGCNGDEVQVATLDELLPESFGPGSLDGGGPDEGDSSPADCKEA
ncbi:MAG: cytidine deaminase [Planctomycetota bacterium]|nr:MAG: cytidine deaminase [Planctomycetota bacterium]